MARAIHDLGPRSARPFLAINCAALPEGLLESELMGVRRGAFTGAQEDRAGLFEEAHEGTLFLDEIGDASLSFQAKLLRVLQERAVRRVGARHEQRVDVRIIAATHRDLRSEITAGCFRADLFYRIRVLPLELPPLRDRSGDIVRRLQDMFEATGKPLYVLLLD